MKSINVSELKANLSKYLRMASRGTQIEVRDRDEPIATIGPPQPEAEDWRSRMAREGRLRLGTQDWASLVITPPKRRMSEKEFQEMLDDVREDPNEVRGF